MTRKLDVDEVKAAIQYLADLQREFATNYAGHVKDLHLACAGAFDEALAAIDSLAAAEEGDGVNKAIEEIDDLRCKLFGDGDTAGESALHTALSILDKHMKS